jgi:hypothetical protein
MPQIVIMKFALIFPTSLIGGQMGFAGWDHFDWIMRH